MANYSTIDYLQDLSYSQMANARTLTVSQNTTGQLGWDNHGYAYGNEPYALLHSIYRFNASTGASYNIFSTSYYDPYIVILYDQYGNAISANSESDDPAGPYIDGVSYGADVLFNWIPPYTGTYYVEASWNQGTYYSFYSIDVYEDFDAVAVLPSVSISTASASILEGSSGQAGYQFTVTRTGNLNYSSTVNYSVSSSQATTADFSGGLFPSGTISFAPGQSSASLIVNIAGDTQIETDESFSVNLTSPTGAVLQTSIAYGVIKNDDVAQNPSNGNDQLDGSTANDLIHGLSGDDFISGWGGNDSIYGDDGNDSIFGDSGNDVIVGGEGNDHIWGGYGDDNIDGGAGLYDIVVFDNQVTINLSLGQASGIEGNDSIINIESVGGSKYDDWVAGTSGENSLWGKAGNDKLFGGDGNDYLDGGDGNDLLDGGDGVDVISYAEAASSVNVNLLTGVAFGGDGNDTIVDVEYVGGSDYDDSLTGSNIINHILGGDGNDTIYGLDGDDEITGNAGNDFLDGGEGFDAVIYRDSPSGVTVDLSAKTASGGSGADSVIDFEAIFGSDYDDFLIGSASKNLFIGSGGNDVINGKAGIDGTGYDSNFSGNFLFSKTASGYEVTALSGTAGKDKLTEIERILFNDATFAIDIDGNAGTVAKILASVFGASAVTNKQYAGIGLSYVDGGMTYEALSALAINAAGAKTREAVVDLLWTNLMGKAPTAAEAQPYIDMLAPNLSNVGTLGKLAGDYAATIGVVNLTALSQTGLEYV